MGGDGVDGTGQRTVGPSRAVDRTVFWNLVVHFREHCLPITFVLADAYTGEDIHSDRFCSPVGTLQEINPSTARIIATIMYMCLCVLLWQLHCCTGRWRVPLALGDVFSFRLLSGSRCPTLANCSVRTVCRVATHPPHHALLLFWYHSFAISHPPLPPPLPAVHFPRPLLIRLGVSLIFSSHFWGLPSICFTRRPSLPLSVSLLRYSCWTGVGGRWCRACGRGVRSDVCRSVVRRHDSLLTR